jgi:8-oxo-dGTP pyrophosphatase MutT (NUDIX family)
MASTGRTRQQKAKNSQAGAWHVEEARWGDLQRVRLVTGPPSLVGDAAVQVRSIHVVAFSGNADDVLLVQNKDQTWTFPGGRLEGSETLHEALVREVWEEARAVLVPDHTPVAATRIEFLNRVPGRVYRVHPTYLMWVAGTVAELSDEPHHDPADGVVGRLVTGAEEARNLLAPLEQVVLNAALAARNGGSGPHS